MVRTLIALVGLAMLAVSPVAASKDRWEEMVEMAGHLRWSGQFAEAEKLLKKALKEAESSGLDDRDLSITLSGLASVYLDQCKYTDAEAAQRRAKEIDERRFPQDPEVLADDLATLEAVS